MRIGNRITAGLWFLGGLLIGLGVATLPSIGWVLVCAGTLALLLAGFLGRGHGWPFMFLALAVPLLWVAWLHRGGPGERYRETLSGSGYQEILDPTPWLAAGLILLLVFVVALGLSWTLRRRRVSFVRSCGGSAQPRGVEDRQAEHHAYPADDPEPDH